MAKPWHKLPRKAVDALSLEVPKARALVLWAGLCLQAGRTQVLWCTQLRERKKGGSLSADSAFGLLSRVAPHLLALCIQLHSACLLELGRGRGSNSLSLVSASGLLCREKSSVTLHSCHPLPGALYPLAYWTDPTPPT